MDIVKYFAISTLILFSASVVADFYKIANDGSVLPSTAFLESGSKDWACTYDSSTHLIWEVKTADKGLRDGQWKYSFTKSLPNQASTGVCFGKQLCDLENYIQQVNAKELCTEKNWRLPTTEELKSILYCSDGKNPDGSCTKRSQLPQTNASYFPHIQAFDNYWTSSVAQKYPDRQTIFSFYNGFAFKAGARNAFLPTLLVSSVSISLKPPETEQLKNPLADSKAQSKIEADVEDEEASAKNAQETKNQAMIDWQNAVNISRSGSYTIVCPVDHPHLVMGGATCKHGHMLSESRPGNQGAAFPNQWFAECFIPNQGIASKPNYIYGWCL